MLPKRTIRILVILIAIFAAVATSMGIFSSQGSGTFQYETIRGETVQIYGRGIYRHMSADVAIQGIAQDYVTLFAGIPLLLISLIGVHKNSIRSRFLLAGTLGYFLVTYLFYTAMAMYNILFLGYVTLLGLSFFTLLLTLNSFDGQKIRQKFSPKTPHKLVGGFLIFNSIMIAFLWLGIVIPPLADGTIYPVELQHYTTLIVQGFDLGLLLPISFVVGVLLARGKPDGFLYGTVYIVFLSILMTALTAKIIAMALNGVNVIPVIFIIPVINIFTIICAGLMLKNIHQKEENEIQ